VFRKAAHIGPVRGDFTSIHSVYLSSNNFINYNDPSGHSSCNFLFGCSAKSTFDCLLGVSYQVVNDILFNLPNTIFGNSWQENQSAQFQSGQVTGRKISNLIGAAATADGIKNTALGLSSMLPTLGGGGACVAFTGGTCAVAVAPVLAGEGALAGVGTLEGVAGTGILFTNSKNSVPGPRYTVNNFRENLENTKPIPDDISQPQAHHILPQALNERFTKLGININDPKWGAWVEGGIHQSWSSAYNQDWVNWLNVNPGASVSDVEMEASNLAKAYGYKWP
jgi:hypothetical protein